MSLYYIVRSFVFATLWRWTARVTWRGYVTDPLWPRLSRQMHGRGLETICVKYCTTWGAVCSMKIVTDRPRPRRRSSVQLPRTRRPFSQICHTSTSVLEVTYIPLFNQMNWCYSFTNITNRIWSLFCVRPYWPFGPARIPVRSTAGDGNVWRATTSWGTVLRDGTTDTHTTLHRLVYISYFTFYMLWRVTGVYANILISIVGFYPDVGVGPSSSLRPGTKQSLNTLTIFLTKHMLVYFYMLRRVRLGHVRSR